MKDRTLLSDLEKLLAFTENVDTTILRTILNDHFRRVTAIIEKERLH